MGERALDDLIAAVEARNSRMSLGYEYAGVLPDDLCFKASDAFDGDLNAVKALHEALLPGWRREISESNAKVYERPNIAFFGEAVDNDARAWLIAILHAYRGMQG